MSMYEVFYELRKFMERFEERTHQIASGNIEPSEQKEKGEGQ